ncbi:hypothetical protein [Legionella sp. km772]|uniref:hypothetical protein n=1 Tax=Legionella sp. km772 TaxID=2498111 RepID=UPI000F8E779F|nr:hypothetical protein [Legionella sp. km772]RUR13201.1 hypothetical protein ELY15_03045 [Legionella sp. km772]
MPTITPQNINSKLDTLESLGKTIAKWTKDLDSAKKAEISLKKFLALSGEISDYIASNLSKTTKAKKGSLLVSYRDKLQEIKTNYPTKGLTSAIAKKIEALETAKASFERAKQERELQNDAALIEVRRLLPLITATVNAYEKARLEDKDAILAQFKTERELLNTQIALLADKGAYVIQINDLSHQVNKRTAVLAQQEEALKAIIVTTATKAKKAVDAMTINEQILAIAPPQVQHAVKKLVAGLTTGDLQKLLKGADSAAETSLVGYARGELVAVAGEKSQISKELAVISDLPQDQQLEVITALISGKDSNGVLATMSQSTQMALSAALINQLAIKANIDKKDQLAIKEFATGLVSSMVRVERGEATHLSVLALVKDYSGQEVIAQFHIDLQSLSRNPVDFSALMALNLLKIGVKEDMQVVTAFTNLPQVGALLQLKGRNLSTLALEDRGLQQLTKLVLEDTSAIKQITNGEVEDVSENALIAATKYSNAMVVSRSELAFLDKQASEKPSIGLVADVIKALAIMNLTVQATVINVASKQALGITNLVGNAPRLLIEDANPIALAASEPKAIEFPSPSPIRAPVKPSINEELVANVNAALDKLKALQTSLIANYGKNPNKQYIVVTNARLIEVLSTALNQYTNDGKLAEFKQACQGAITEEMKKQYNTHRDNVVTQFFAAIAHAFSNLFSALFANAESKQTKAGMVGFFNSASRHTRSAAVLYTFNNELKNAFDLIDVPEEDLEHELSSQALAKCH